jgi:hypothetical protein
MIDKSTRRFLIQLHSTSLACTTLINQAHAWNEEWMDSLRLYDQQGVVPLFPLAWEGIIGEARELLMLCEGGGEIDRWNFWWVFLL